MRKSIITFIILSFFTFVNVLGESVKRGINTDKPLNALIINQWTGQDGLVSNNLTSVFQSSSNFIWVTTFNGFLRFDGVEFKLFDKSKISFLSSNGFYKGFEDSKGNLWFCSQSSGVIKYAYNNFEQILPVGRNSLSVRAIYEDHDGNIWLGTNNEGLYLYKNQKLTKVNLKEYDLSYIMDIVIDKDGAIYLATNGDGLLKFKEGELEQVAFGDGKNHNALNKLYIDNQGTIYVGSLDGLYYFNEKGQGEIEALRGKGVNDIEIDDYDNIWVASEQGLFMVNLASNTVKQYTDKEGLPGTQVSDLCFDHENSLWISTKKAGLLRLRDGFFRNIRTEEGLTTNNVNIIVENKGKFYIGCDDGNISVINGNQIEDYKINTPEFNLGIRDMHFDEDGEVLIASYRGLLRKRNNQETLINLNQFGASNDVRRILKSIDGSIWLATRSSGVIKLDKSGKVDIYDSSNSLKTNYIMALEENPTGDILIGTHSGGVSIIRSDGTVENRPVEEGKSGILIFNFQLIDDKRFWIATNIGVYKFEDQTFKKIELDEKLNAETIFDIEIIDDYAWLTSNMGLIRIKTNDLDDYLNNRISSVPGRLLDRFDGMASQECTGATRMTFGSDNNIWIPTLGGASVLDPQKVVVNDKVPNVYITDFYTDFQSRSVSGDSRLEVAPGTVRYEFKFTSLSFVAPPKIHFKYRLAGMDTDWIDVASKREVVYTNLPKGNYTFTVIASNNDGVWNETGASIQFKVKPFFYETTIFYILVVILIGLIIWGIIVLRVRSVEKRNSELRKLNEELDRFVYSASHDLRAPLSSVLGLVEIARLETTLEAKQQCLDMINTSVKKLDGFINDIIDYSRNQRIDIKPELLDLQTEVDDALSELKYLDKENKIEKTVEVDGEGKLISDGRRLNIILKNIISNAVRYHNLAQSNPYIKIKISSNSHSSLISIADNGIGIDNSHLENIFKMFYRADESSKGSGLGLYIVKETIDKMGGTVEVHSQLNSGTTFTIKLPNLKLPEN